GTRLDIHRPVAGIPGARHEAEAVAIIAGGELDMLSPRHLAEDKAVAHDMAVADDPSGRVLVAVDLESAVAGGVIVDIDRSRAAHGSDSFHCWILRVSMLGPTRSRLGAPNASFGLVSSEAARAAGI